MVSRYNAETWCTSWLWKRETRKARSGAYRVRSLQRGRVLPGHPRDGGFAVTDWPSVLAGANVTMIALGVVALIVLVTLLAPTPRHLRNLKFATLVVCAVLAILILVAANPKPEEPDNGAAGATGTAAETEGEAANAAGAGGEAAGEAADTTRVADAAGGGTAGVPDASGPGGDGGALGQNRAVQIQNCVAEEEARVAFTRTFRVRGEADCPGGGCVWGSGNCNKREAWASYAAPGTYYLDSYSSTEHHTNYGSIGGLEVTERDDTGRALAVRVHLSCDPPDRLGGPGGWSRAVIAGIERLRNEEDRRRRIREECDAAQGP